MARLLWISVFLLFVHISCQSDFVDDDDLRKELTELKEAVKRLQTERDDLQKLLRGSANRVVSHPPTQLPVKKNLDKSAFSATLASDVQVIDGDILVFDTILTDNRGDYDPTFGFFTCRDGGVYMFIITVVAPAGYASSASMIMQSGSTETIIPVVPETYDVGLAYTGPHTAHAIIECAADDLVYIKAASPTGGSTVWYAGGNRTIFTGYYI